MTFKRTIFQIAFDIAPELFLVCRTTFLETVLFEYTSYCTTQFFQLDATLSRVPEHACV